MGSDRYCLRWNNHQNNLLGVFNQLLQEESLVDVTLACSEGHSIRAHKVVLSACSSYFQTLFKDHPNRHPIVILKDVCFAELRTLVDFMYRGEANLEFANLPAFLKTAESLQVRGLAEMTHLSASTTYEMDTTTQPLPLTRHPRSPVTSPPPTSASVSPVRSFSAPTSPPRSYTPPNRPLSLNQPMSPRVMSPDRRSSGSHDDDTSSTHSGPNDMTIHRLSPPFNEPGPSNCPPVQEAPLSLTKQANHAYPEQTETRGTSDENASDFNVSRHLQETERYGRYTCVYCGVAFSSHNKLARHMLSHNFQPLKPGNELPVIQEPQAHRELVPYPTFPEEPQQPVPEPPGPECRACGLTFSDLNTLLSHMPSHTGERPFKCEFCGKGFKLRHHMKDHCRVHTGERPFRCTLCGKTFSRSTILKAHEKTHYPKYVRKFLPSLDAQEPLRHPDETQPLHRPSPSPSP